MKKIDCSNFHYVNAYNELSNLYSDSYDFCRLLGISYSSHNKYINSHRVVPGPVIAHINTLYKLNDILNHFGSSVPDGLRLGTD